MVFYELWIDRVVAIVKVDNKLFIQTRRENWRLVTGNQFQEAYEFIWELKRKFQNSGWC